MDSDATTTTDAAKQQRVLGEALRELRRRVGITQEELAVRAAADATYLSQVETGKRGVRWYTVMRLLDALDADLHQLADAIAEVERQDPPSKR
jgi:HTH-type transcriptional regulator, competence development regulator